MVFGASVSHKSIGVSGRLRSLRRRRPAPTVAAPLARRVTSEWTERAEMAARRTADRPPAGSPVPPTRLRFS